MFEDDLDLESVCRLCLNPDGNMSRIHDAHTEDQSQYSLCDKILILASVQIAPDDGLPSLICGTCQTKVEQFIEFKELIEHSYNILCQCLSIASGSKSTADNIENCSVTKIAQPTSLIALKDSTVNQRDGKTKNKKVIESNLSSLFKDHLVSGIPESEILVNQDFSFVNVANVSYINVSDDTADNYMSISLPEDAISLESNTNILSKDISIVTRVENNESIMAYPKTCSTNDTAKIFNVSFPDNNGDNLQDLFLGLENDSETCQDGFEDISKYLKSSHGLDIKKLKEDYKNKESCSDVDQEVLKKKLMNCGISLIKSSPCDGKVKQLPGSVDPKATKTICGSDQMTMADNGGVYVHNLDLSETTKDEVEDVNNFPDMIFAIMPAAEKDKYTMDDCQKEIFPRIVKITHLNSGTPASQFRFDTYLCHLCLTEFRECSMSVLKNHSDSHFGENIKAVCQSEPIYCCEDCVERFTSRHSFVNHQRRKLKIKVFACEKCNKYFWSKDKLSFHSRIHSDKVPVNKFSCLFCGETFCKKQELNRHEECHTRDTPLICQHCGKECNNVVALKSHLKRHTEGLKYCCEICGKGFYTMLQLQRHEQGHSGFRKFPCHFCSKAFCSNSERKRHLRYHFRTKRFQCTMCEKKFYEAGHLKIHMQSHTNHRPFICDICASSFHTRYKLKRHVLNHQKSSKQNTKKKSTKKTDSIVEPKFIKLSNVQLSDSDENLSSNLVASLSDEENLVDGESYIIIQGDYEEDGEDNINADLFNADSANSFSDGQIWYVMEDNN